MNPADRRSRPGTAIGLVEGVATAVRRRQREREPRVLLFNAAGEPRVVAPSAFGYDDLLDAAERLLEASPADAAGEERRTSRFAARRSRRADEPEM
jgi:hypothetical protein